jgi:short-subunit dehydrogenase
MPYYINTGMFDGVKSSKIKILEPEAASLTIIKQLKQKMITIPGYLYRFVQNWANNNVHQSFFDWFAGSTLKENLQNDGSFYWS